MITVEVVNGGMLQDDISWSYPLTPLSLSTISTDPIH